MNLVLLAVIGGHSQPPFCPSYLYPNLSPYLFLLVSLPPHHHPHWLPSSSLTRTIDVSSMTVSSSCFCASPHPHHPCFSKAKCVY